MSHGGPTMRAVPRMLNFPHVDDELLHLADTQGCADHDLNIKVTGTDVRTLEPLFIKAKS